MTKLYKKLDKIDIKHRKELINKIEIELSRRFLIKRLKINTELKKLRKWINTYKNIDLYLLLKKIN